VGDEGHGGVATEVVDRRGETFAVVEAAHWKKEGNFTDAVQAYGRACYEFAISGGYWPEKEAPVPSTPEAMPSMTYVVQKEEMKLAGTFYLIFADGVAKTPENIVCFSPRQKDAERIAKALSEVGV
jgi:hypothetical protein